MFRHIRWMAAALLVAACGSAGPTLQPSVGPPLASTPAQTGAVFGLNPAPENMGCDTIGVGYREVVFKVDQAAADPVTALADTGTVLRTFWAAGFMAGPAEAKVVLDHFGGVIVTDGDKLAIPEGAFPRLQGYFVCPSPDALYILAADPQ